ncbi:hypothetical protein BJX61DRAFT_514492 [Aspergillus egyptiacus]|nr:hypothetical protein BJX61DRAFT_514492 [Aspergillus egyptiacus]
MPKKHHKTPFSKPVSTPHHTLATSPRQNDRARSSAEGEQPSVNDLINHLRRTQVSSSPDSNHSPSRHVAPRSVHPSIRNLLELPETPPPRPRPDARRIGIVGGRRLRRTPGPPPPASWLSDDTSVEEADAADLDAPQTAEVIYRLDRLPGREFPAKSSFLHAVLKEMASHWAWHVVYDGQFLGILPMHIKILLLSYIGYYGREQPLRGLVRGLKPLFEGSGGVEEDGHDMPTDNDSEITRLDLTGAIGRWMTLKELSAELLQSRKPHSSPRDTADSVPTSWEDEYEEGPEPSISKPVQTLRFSNLQYLSLAHPNPASVNWNSLITLLSRLSTITHLSLAHWPVPTITPRALKACASIRNPAQRSLTFSYGGTDTYSAMENNWAESAGLLRKLSRVTYCLKWLDLEGCGDWIPALNWEGVGPDGETYPAGPEWNGSWRDIEFIRLGPGWLPSLDDDEFPTPATPATSRSLAFSTHAPTTSSVQGVTGEAASTETWDVEVERRRYRLKKVVERFREEIRAARAVQQRVLQVRKEMKGKWVRFSFGLEGVEEDLLERLLGEEGRGIYP